VTSGESKQNVTAPQSMVSRRSLMNVDIFLYSFLLWIDCTSRAAEAPTLYRRAAISRLAQ
jgi:hypothetical protein